MAAIGGGHGAAEETGRQRRWGAMGGRGTSCSGHAGTGVGGGGGGATTGGGGATTGGGEPARGQGRSQDLTIGGRRRHRTYIFFLTMTLHRGTQDNMHFSITKLYFCSLV